MRSPVCSQNFQFLVKIEGGFDKSKEKAGQKFGQQNSDIACCENLILRRKIFILENLIMPKVVKGGPLGLFENLICCKSKKLKGDLKYSEKKSNKAKKSKWGPFSLVQFYKCTKRFLTEAGTRTRDCWVPANPIGRSS